jgi:DNA-binding response OmpR family regulator
VPRILLVDDDKDQPELFTMILENEGYSVDAYADPDTALSKFRPNYYDLSIVRLPYASSKWSRIIQKN